jgi:hypothetical protein
VVGNALAAIERCDGMLDAAHLPLIGLEIFVDWFGCEKRTARPVLLANRSSRFFTPVSTRTVNGVERMMSP